MPMSSLCVSIVSNKPRRTWSVSNIPSKDVYTFYNMNSAEDITTYKDPPFYSPNLQRRTLGCSYDFPEKPHKKEKKWSISSIFRRKKKDSESTSDEDVQKKGFLGRRKKKSESKRKKSVPFDHVVKHPIQDTAVMSDPTGCPNYITIPISGSVDNIKKKRELTKARAEARRNSSQNGSSSEDESQHSSQIYSENLKNKKSRIARTERYLKRHSRDGENPHNYLRISTNSDESNRSLSRSPLIPKLSYTSLNSQISNSTSNPNYKPPQSMNDYNNSIRKYDNHRSVSCGDNIHIEDIQFPIAKPKRGLRNLSLIDTSKYPPPPPPRDPNRTNRPNTFYFDNTYLNYRSTSENHLARNTINSPPVQTRPSSTTPESKYNYLTDKKPRSRKPIVIKPTDSNNKAVNFWKQIDREAVNQTKPPQMFSSHTHIQTEIFLPSAEDTKRLSTEIYLPSPIQADDAKRKSTNLEEALNELEAIYNSLKLGDEDLLDRAEQKENEEMDKKHNYISNKGAMSDSTFSYEPFDSSRRKRTSKRSHNLKLDDMAYRKINKNRSNTIGDPQNVHINYLMRSPFSSNHTIDEPDVTLDDVVYRNVKHSNNLLKVVEPQPPFGIPLGPITPAANSDYLHAKPEVIYKPSFKHKKIPDIVKDDLAFRNLRKDHNKEPALPPLSNNLQYLKKKRAQRSMSANIGNILGNNKNEDVENSFKNLTDIADAMEIARQVLKEKENRISATKKAFMSDTDANMYKRFTKESTPIPLSPLECASTGSSLDDLLNALARETTREMNKLGDDAQILDSKDYISALKSEEEDVRSINEELPLESATVVMSRFDRKDDPDYENLVSDNEVKCLSPFEERKAELIASFQELKEDEASDKYPIRRLRFPRWLRSRSHGNLQDYSLDMSNTQESRSDRIARYKEERRKQLAEQFSSYQSPTKARPSGSIKDGTSANIESPRPTRTSRLRAAALSQENISIQSQNITEKSPTLSINESELKAVGSKRIIERDKSNKRKSNLNRSQNSEEVPSNDVSTTGDIKDRRRRRRFFPAEVFESDRSDTTTTASLTSPTPTSNTAVTPSKLTPKKSELSKHMENARRSVTETGKYKPYPKRATSSPKSSTTRLNVEKVQSNESLPRTPRMVASDDEKTKAIASRMEGLSALTKQTLARVERLTKSPFKKPSTLCSILKKNSVDETQTPVIIVDNPSLPVGPVSILKRKVSQENNPTHTSPVTFSPSVLEPTTTRRKQGILKKRRSLDESTVLRHRSCSPDVANKPDSRSILKNQRRSSLEELRRIQSPETHLQSILKRRTSKYEDEDSPQSILKRRSGASSAGSTGSSPHVSITTAVILAAAGGAEMVLDSEGESVRPILKKKSFSEDYAHHSDALNDVPKPILKKKSSTDTDDSEEKPRPILKLPRTSLDLDVDYYMDLKNYSETECEVRPILKQSNKDESSRRLSFRAGFSETRDDVRHKTSRRSNTICSDYNINSFKIESREEDSLMTKPRPFSVYDLVLSFEQTTSTGAIPKRNQYKRSSDRYKTQPVTINELEASRNLVKSPQQLEDQSVNQNNFSRSCDAPSLLDFTSSLERDADHLNNFFSSSMRSQDSPESIACGKMSSDSAFQSLGDGLELEQVEEHLQESEQEQTSNEELSTNLLKISAAEDTSKIKSFKGNVGIDRYRARRSGLNSQFLTQPVTFEEIKAATNLTTNSDGGGDKSKPIFKKTITSPDKDDEGISCNDSGSSSDSDTSSSNSKKKVGKKFGGDSTSDGESSGGREIKSIFKSDKLKIIQNYEGVLIKSRSQESLKNTSKTVQSQSQNEMPQAIADLRAKLKERGESDWKKRVSLHNSASDELKMLKEKNKYNDEISEKSLLSAKKVELDAASRHWKSRVEKSDAEKFSVAGKMSDKIKNSVPAINIPGVKDAEKRTPQPKRFKLKEGPDSTPTSPEKNHFDLTRSKSLSYHDSFNFNSSVYDTTPKISKKSVSVLNPDDITLKEFFTSFEPMDNKEKLDLQLEDLDAIQRQSLLVIRKNVQVRRRRGASKNPIKALASRTDISDEYTEIITGVAEREKKRLNIEKLAKNSNKALEALAGLASNEDFKSVALKKSSGHIGQVPWNDIMLLQVKGRRHVQTRLVEPKASSINEGDNYILIANDSIYTYTGAYSNVIEQSRTSDVVNHIKKTGDLGCKGSHVYSISARDQSSKPARSFWRILGTEETPKTIEAGHPDEDETYESNILLTNMIYSLDKDELIPCDRYWGAIPRIEMLKDTNIFVFDFGSEMYVWSGKNAPLGRKKTALKLAKELWEEGYNYSDCNVCPLNVAAMLGARTQEKSPLQDNARPAWVLFAKLTQHRETILFKEKFLDWPDFSRIIRPKGDDIFNNTSASFDIQPCDVDEMLKEKDRNPDLIVENVHMGRGDQYFDEETKRLFVFETLNVTGWRILEYSYEKLPQDLLGQFYDGDSYIFKWDFRQTVRGRELGGNPSRHAAVGRDRCIFFCWQGTNSSINEKGAAALLTVELDKENAPQIRIAQGSEPAAFLHLFNGTMVVYRGKKPNQSKPKLFTLRGERKNEVFLMEVPLSMSSLRSRTSFVLHDSKTEQLIIWHGIKSSNVQRKNVKTAVDNLQKTECVIEVIEGSETEDFLNILHKNEEYHSLLDSKEEYNHTVRLYRMCSLTGDFLATEILCPHRSEHCTPYPFMQSDLYSASQPALFLIDNHHELWLWQGFWPEKETEDSTLDQIGSGAVRWQAERKAAMQTAVRYWRKKRGSSPIVAHLVSAGVEPVAFKNLFPTWEDRLDIMELNKKAGKTEGEMVALEEELTLLSRTIYPLSELLKRPLPEGVNPSYIEKYLSVEDFQELLSMSKEEFHTLPAWKKTALKKEKGLF